MEKLFFLITGLVAGIGSGLFGIGGGILVILFLTSILKVPHHTANGISLIALLLPVGILGVLEYYRSGKIGSQHVVPAIVIAVGIFIGAFVGSKIAVSLPEVTLRRGFGIFLVGIGLRLFFK